ncbi:hypothetical protein [Streptomyces sp. NPDC058291]|uniref:hypothetical protein n=1 Tax=Streptomyces sp. NPDC058291 TaxID=3346427 RepID=UPI0036E355A9
MTTTSSPEVGPAGLRAPLHLIDPTSLDAPKARTDIRIPQGEHGRGPGVSGTSTRRTHDPVTERTCPAQAAVTDAPDTDGRRPAGDTAS